jgi:predicted P-loop ATPase
MDTPARDIPLHHDGVLVISTGHSRRTRTWKQKQVRWSTLIQQLGTTKRTQETQARYLKLSKAEQDDIKDVGGFVGGALEGGRRTAACAGRRQLVTLDADYADQTFWARAVKAYGSFSLCCYSTHKHTPKSPRLRLVLPLDRPVTPDEYQAIARRVAYHVGIDMFDDTTYQPQRLMYWPSTSADGEFFFRWQDGSWLSADALLREYPDWKDQASWPVSSRQTDVVRRAMRKQEDPLTKEGIVGAFCRAYTIPEVIDAYLSDIYERCEGHEDRYTYKPGSSSGGAVVYEDKWLYSHHATDPTSMKLCNAFDLVRLHLFGGLDDCRTTADVTKLPSWKSMVELCSKDTKVSRQQMTERLQAVQDDFGDLGDEDPDEDLTWMKRLQRDRKGHVLPSRENIRIILNNDSRIRGTFGWDEFAQRIAILKAPPWRQDDNRSVYWGDADDSELRYLLETLYGIDSKQKIEDETLNAAMRHSFHDVRNYLHGLTWDGTPRMETIFIDYLGAEDTPYTRTVTRKMLIAAVGRVEHPGLKFDNMVVLEGPQGIGKSYIFKKLGRKWFSDSLTTVQGKEAYEQLRGSWIIEMGELAALKKSEVEPIKQFISKQVDAYRVAYGRRISEFPRQCIFVGTTNEATFLRDHTGNRRFWPIRVGIKEPKKSLWEPGVDAEIDQIWAEAETAWNAGEDVWIGRDMERTAKDVQLAHTEENPYVGMIQEYLETELPENWYTLDITARRNFIRGEGFTIEMGQSFKRTRICPLEVWCEMLGGDPKRFSGYDRKEIRDALGMLPGWELYRSGQYKLSFGRYYGRQRGYVKKGVKIINGDRWDLTGV